MVIGHNMLPVFVWIPAETTLFDLPSVASVSVVGAPEAEYGFVIMVCRDDVNLLKAIVKESHSMELYMCVVQPPFCMM
jgi:hypothetical protein